jgi:sortase A
MLIAPGYGLTHFLASAPIGQGNAVLYGHDDIDGSVFSRLGELQAGDLITISLPGVTQSYRVTDRKIVTPKAVEILAPTSDIRLTLFTCWPNNVDTKRVVLTAALAHQPVISRIAQ